MTIAVLWDVADSLSLGHVCTGDEDAESAKGQRRTPTVEYVVLFSAKGHG